MTQKEGDELQSKPALSKFKSKEIVLRTIHLHFGGTAFAHSNSRVFYEKVNYFFI